MPQQQDLLKEELAQQHGRVRQHESQVLDLGKFALTALLGVISAGIAVYKFDADLLAPAVEKLLVDAPTDANELENAKMYVEALRRDMVLVGAAGAVVGSIVLLLILLHRGSMRRALDSLARTQEAAGLPASSTARQQDLHVGLAAVGGAGTIGFVAYAVYFLGYELVNDTDNIGPSASTVPPAIAAVVLIPLFVMLVRSVVRRQDRVCAGPNPS